MKRFTLIVAMVLMMAMPMMAERVTPETARKVATTFLNNNGAKSAQLTDLSKEAGFENLYIFNGEEGFVVMAADDCVQPILGYSLTGKFVAEGMPENLIWWLQGYSDQIQDAINASLAADADVKTEWQNLKSGLSTKMTSDVVVGPLLSTLWDQNYPYNYHCPAGTGGPGGHVYTGCVATAMAQVLKYWNYPSTGNDSYSYTHPTYGEQTANFGETIYDWANMPSTLSGSSPQIQIDAVATLMYHCGVSVDMNYGTNTSSASSRKVRDAFINYFRFSPSTRYVSRDAYTDDLWIDLLKHELDESRPLFYCGKNVNSGHAFVCDGYRSDDYFHFNWGWSGYDGSYGTTHGNNGYWAIGALNPGSGGSGSGSGTYNLANAILAWAEPDKSSILAAPILSASDSEGTAYLTWTSVNEASSYDVYKDNEIIVSGTTDLSYSDSGLSFGEYHDYYVRAISGTNKSNPSNFVTIHSTYRDIRPSDLTASYEAGQAHLSWTGCTGLSTQIHYGTGYDAGAYGSGSSNGTYWGQRYLAEDLENFDGMYISKVSLYIRTTGNYTLFIYKDDVADEANELLSQAFTANATGWHDVVLADPILLDISKDLWVAFYSSSLIPYPATYGSYYADAPYRNYAQRIGTTLAEIKTYITGDDISWTMKTTLTDGTFTYNLYDNGVSVADDIATTSFTVAPTNNTVHQYTVTTNYGGESAASNMAGLTIGTATLASLELGTNDMMTITEGSSLTVEGTLTNTNPDNLILEDGAQLINSSTDVKATVKKDITAFTTGENDGWNLIASPFTESITPNNENGLTLGDFDLYRFNQNAQPDNQGNALEWENWKNQSSDHYQFSLKNGEGYLYSNSNDQSLVFQGTLTADAEPTALNYDGDANLKGFNLIGTPYPCNAYTTQPFYVLQYNANEDCTKFVLGSGAIPPCAAIMVQAQGEGETVAFSKTALRNKPNITVSVAKADMRGNAIIDKARIGFEPSYRLAKFDFSESNSQLYIPQNGQEFAVAYANEETEMPLNFKATQKGTYTLSFETEDLELNYLHLIDNLTGNDVDLLATPTYTFEANTSDYTTRFRLLFAPVCEDANDDNATFAFISDGNIIVNDAGEASLQIVDMMGRVVVEEDATNRISISEMAPGVYVLRLIDGEKVKTQKIVIE